MVCKVECIKQIVQKPSVNGKTVKYLAGYVDKSAGFSEIIPISKSVADYISTCTARYLTVLPLTLGFCTICLIHSTL